ncbi:MAG: AAA family ATPase [Deltaproteobacteria bacterium]|nr:AAA family ATPase [Deltaproteobacteria bacterium]
MRCSNCQADNPAENRFCEQCGTPLEVCCPQCGATVRPGSRFCGACGHRLAQPEAAAPAPASGPSAAAPVAADYQVRLVSYTPKHLAQKILTTRSALEGERRQVTVLFADTAGFTALAEKLDPEDVHQILDRCFELITAAVHRFEGTINQYTGDGVMALFGAPIAHEDGPRRAVHAALAIQQELRDFSKELQAQRGFSLQMRIGLNTGLVVVGKIGDDLRMDYTAVGDTTNLAARMQQLARPDSVVVSEATHKLIAGYFETLDLGELQVKGHDPVRAFEALRPRGRRARLDVAVERGLTSLVGRERELGTLLDLFRQVKSGQGQVVFVAGEAGIGKSRLLLEFHRALAQVGEEVTWLEGRCISFGHSIPFLPLIDQLRENFRIEEFDGEPEIIAKVEHGMRRLGGLEAHIPYIRYLLSVDSGDSAVTAMDPSARRKQVFDALRALSLRGAKLRPLVLVFEDLHWIDSSTEEYLSSFVDSVTGLPLLLILTYRVGYNVPFGSRSFFTTLNLHSLSEADARTMASRVLGTDQFPQELTTALMEKAEGVPLFVEEVTKTLLDLGVLRREDGGYRLVKGIAEVNVPDTIQGIIMARLDRLGEDGKRTVQLASVIGRQFLQRLLERIAGLTGKLEGLLHELKTLEIIYEQGLLPEPAYVFKHAVIQDVAYNSLLLQRRRELHKAVGQAIEELYPDRLAEHYEELAYHFARGEEWQKAMAYGVVAGDRAAHAFANAEAKEHYARALLAATQVSPLPDPEIVARLHAKHGAVLMVLAEYEEAVAAYQRALELVRQVKNRQGEIEILVELSMVYVSAHREEPATEYGEQALVIARELGDPVSQAICLANRVYTVTTGRGPTVETTRDAEESLRLAREIEDPKLQAQTLIQLGRTLEFRGDFDRSLTHLQEGVELAQRLHMGFMFGQAAFFIGHAHLAKGEYEEALRWYRQLSEYASAAGDKFHIARAPNCIGGVHLELFDLAEAVRVNLEAEEVARKTWPWPEPRGHCLVKAGLAYLLQDERDLAEECFRRAWALLEADTWMRWRWHIPLLRARGELALVEGRRDEAWTYAVQSLEMATRTDSRKHVARAQWLQGEVLAASGRLEEATQMLEASVKLAESLQTPREVGMGKAALGKFLARMGKDKEAETQFTQAVKVIEAIAEKLRTPHLHRSFLGAEPVLEVYRALGQRPPLITDD